MSTAVCAVHVHIRFCLSVVAALQNFTRFSSWFGNYSHGNKQHRLLAELSCAMAAGDTGATCSRNSVRRDYLPALRQVGGFFASVIWSSLSLVAFNQCHVCPLLSLPAVLNR